MSPMSGMPAVSGNDSAAFDSCVAQPTVPVCAAYVYSSATAAEDVRRRVESVRAGSSLFLFGTETSSQYLVLI